MTTVRSAELLAVGTELLLGEIVDTNSAWLARELADRSVDVYWSQRVGDNRTRIAAAVRAALQRSDLVVVCGGLGPTDDDLTREAIADVVGETPRVDPNLEATLRDRFTRAGRDMPARNLKQAWSIPSAEALANPHGTAPGWFVRVRAPEGQRRVVVALPGPPHELVPMWREQVRPRLTFPGTRFVATTLKTFGIGESHVAERLDAWTRSANPSVATYAKRDGVHVRVAAKAEDEAAARALLEPALEAVERALDAHVWGRDGDELAARAVAAVAAHGGRVALVDLATGGRLAALLTEAEASLLETQRGSTGPVDVPSLSRTWRGGVIAWGDEALDVLGVPNVVRRPEGPAADAGDVLPEPETDAAVVLARAACARFATDHGVALTAWRAGAADGQGERTSFTAAWAVVAPSGAIARRATLPPMAADVRDERLAFTVLHALGSLT